MEASSSSDITRLETENKRLRRAVEELSVLNDIATAITSTLSLDTIVDLIVQKCVKHLGVEQGAVLLFGEKEESDALRTMVRRIQSDMQTIPYRLSDQITGWMLKNQAPLRVNDLATDGRFRVADSPGPEIRSLLCVPLRLKGKMIGVLSVFNKRTAEAFSDSDQRLLTIIGAQSAQVIENARLYEEEKALQLMQQELQMAHEIQRNLLPKSTPAAPGYELAGHSVAARNVGGDYFDLIPTDGGVALCLGDVSGKGMPAAMLMANVQATVRAQTLLGPSPGACLGRSNRLLHDSTDSDKFVTLFYGLLDAGRHRLNYSNGGHNPPWLVSTDGTLRTLSAGGPVLGVLPEARYEEATVDVQPGDLLLIYSDGFPEAMNSNLEEFGEERFCELVVQHRRAPAEKLIETLYAAVREFCGDEPQSDDMTVVAARRLE
jgi:sigma-B regulation protein RsbU (phosphoserine phosphatase)